MKKLVFSFLVDFSYNKSIYQSIPLIKSIREFGGELKDSDILLCHVGKITPKYLKEIENIEGIITKEVEQFHPNHKHSNKLRIIEQEEIFNYEYLCLLDCDTCVLGDISKILSKGKLKMKMADGKTVSSEIMRNVFSLNEMQYPEEKYLTTLRQPTIAYCNNGVLICDTTNKEFFDIWIEKTKWVCDNQVHLGPSKFFSEQVSLSLAIYSSGIDFEEVPVLYNFPTHIGFPFFLDIKIIHYHDQMDSGQLKTPYIQINSKINTL